GAAVARRPCGGGGRHARRGGVPPLRRAPACRAREADSDDEADAGRRRAARRLAAAGSGGARARGAPHGEPRGGRRAEAGRGGRDLCVRDARRHARGARRDPRVSADRGTPADELELKARIEDPEALRGALTHAGATLEFRGDMIDRRFDRDGALSRRDEVLRLRVFRPVVDAAGSTYGMLGWKGPNSRRDGYRHRAEAEARVADPETV